MYFGGGDGGILIDIGKSAKKTANLLRGVGVDPYSLGGIFLTHEHIDHVSGLRVFTKRFSVPVYASAGTLGALAQQNLLDPAANVVELGKDGVEIAGITVRPFHTSHDCREGYGYTIGLPDGRTAALATDLGFFSDEVRAAVEGKDLVVIESNHDVRMLQNGPYPYPLKRRILSDTGHLSNESCACALPDLVKKGSTRFVLAHLSRENNLPQLARQTSLAQLQMSGMTEHIDYELLVAPQENDGAMMIF